MSPAELSQAVDDAVNRLQSAVTAYHKTLVSTLETVEQLDEALELQPDPEDTRDAAKDRELADVLELLVKMEVEDMRRGEPAGRFVDVQRRLQNKEHRR